jgi:hypothetical protein
MTTSARAIRNARDAARQREIDERAAKIEAAKAEAERIRALSETSAMKALIGEDTDRLLEIALERIDDAAAEEDRSEESRSWLSRLIRLLRRARTRP